MKFLQEFYNCNSRSNKIPVLHNNGAVGKKCTFRSSLNRGATTCLPVSTTIQQSEQVIYLSPRTKPQSELVIYLSPTTIPQWELVLYLLPQLYRRRN